MIGQIEHTEDVSVIGPILKVLRDKIEDDLFDQRLACALANGYRVLVTKDASACLGYHIAHDVFWGKTLYIDDLVVRPELRSSGIGHALLERAKVEARTLGCDHVRLCSGLKREDAHRFYEANGITRASIQFAHSLEKGTL